jgi:hypothetical protein
MRALRQVKSLFLIAITTVASHTACGKKSGQSPVVSNNSPAVDQDPNDEAPQVTVNGTARDERIEFVQAGESVQIGGVNLTRTERVLSVEILSDAGTWTSWGSPIGLTAANFSIQVPAGAWYRLTDSGSALAVTLQAVPESLARESAVVLHVALNQTTTVASRLFDQIASSVAGDERAARLIKERAVPIASLTALAASIVSGSERGASGLDLVQVAQRFVAQTDTTRQAVAAVSAEDWSRTLASSSVTTFYAEVIMTSSIATAANTATLALAGSLIAGGFLAAESGFVDAHPGLRTAAELANSAPTVAMAMGAAVVLASSQYESWVGSGSMPPVTDESVTQKTDVFELDSTWTSAPQSKLVTVVDNLEPPPPSSQVVVPSSASSTSTTVAEGSGSSTVSTWLSPPETTSTTAAVSSSTTTTTMPVGSTTSTTLSAPEP